MSADDFYVLKGLLFLVSTVMLVWYMSRAWNETTGWGQRLRYLTLLYFAALLTTISVKQARAHPTVQWFNVGAMFGAILLIATMVVSAVEYQRKRSS